MSAGAKVAPGGQTFQQVMAGSRMNTQGYSDGRYQSAVPANASTFKAFANPGTPAISPTVTGNHRSMLTPGQAMPDGMLEALGLSGGLGSLGLLGSAPAHIGMGMGQGNSGELPYAAGQAPMTAAQLGINPIQLRGAPSDALAKEFAHPGTEPVPSNTTGAQQPTLVNTPGGTVTQGSGNNSVYSDVDWNGYRARGRQLHQGINNMPGVMRNPAALAGQNPEDVRQAMYPQSDANFDTAAYLSANPDVASSSFSGNPFAHYDQYGRAEGRTRTNRQGSMDLSQIIGIAMRLGLLGPSAGGTQGTGSTGNGVGLLNLDRDFTGAG